MRIPGSRWMNGLKIIFLRKLKSIDHGRVRKISDELTESVGLTMLSHLQVPFFISHGIRYVSRMCSRKRCNILLFILTTNVIFALYSTSVQFDSWKTTVFKNQNDTATTIPVTGKVDWISIPNVTSTTLTNATALRHNDTSVSVKNITRIGPNVRFILSPTHICTQESESGSRSNSSKTIKILLTIIHTARDNFNARSLLRNTIGSVKSYENWSLPVLFIVGTDVVDPNSLKNATYTDELLSEEFHQHNDLIFADFLDTYRNLSLKHLVALQWATEYCPQASFYLKTDDDYLIEIFQVVNLITTIAANDTSFYCKLAKEWPPARNPKLKYFVSKKEFPGKTYPDFCNGMYITRMPTIKKILQIYQRQRVKYLFLEDVFVSGILRETWNKQAGIAASEKINITTGIVTGHLTLNKTSIDEGIPRMNLTEINTERNSSRTCELWKEILNVHSLQNNYPVLGC